MQALPIFLDDMFNELVAVILSVTFVLAFGEVRSTSADFIKEERWKLLWNMHYGDVFL